MSNHRKVQSQKKTPVAIAISVVGVVIVVGVWWWSQTKVELDDRGYDMTLALYRVCNQRSDSGLSQIASMLNEQEPPPELSGESRTVIAKIIDTAESGDWDNAQLLARRALEDQVKRR